MAEESRPREASGRSRLAALNERVRRFEQSAAGRYWRHLSTADFMNSSFAFAALAVLSAFPFLAVSSTVVGGDIRRAIVARMGLNAQATHDVDGLIATGNQAVATLTWVSAFVAVLGAIGMASTLQSWYLRIYEQPAQKGFARRLLYQSAGVVAFTLYISFEVWLFDKVRPFGGRGSSSCSRSSSRCSSGGGRPTCSFTGECRSASSFPPAWRQGSASRAWGSSRQCSSRARSRRDRGATARRAS